MTLPLSGHPDDPKAQESFDEIAQQFPIGTQNLASWPHARVYNSAAQTITNNTATLLTFDSEHWDQGGIHSTTANTDRLTAPVPALYLIHLNVEWAANAVGQRTIWVVNTAATVLGVSQINATAAGTAAQIISFPYYLVAGEYVSANVLQTSGGNLNVNAAANYSPEFSLTWLSN